MKLDTFLEGANAQASYGEALYSINNAMENIQELLKDHRQKAMSDPQNWGYAGDLNYVAKLMTQAVDFLRSHDPE